MVLSKGCFNIDAVSVSSVDIIYGSRLGGKLKVKEQNRREYNDELRSNIDIIIQL